MEIERKFLIKDLHSLPFSIEAYPHRELEQAYLCTGPVVRIRKDDEQYFLTYKSKGLMIREEYNLPLNRQAYLHLREKADGRIIQKTRYVIPLDEVTDSSPSQKESHLSPQFREKGVSLYLNGEPSTPKKIAKACQIAEDGVYMRDYTEDEEGHIACVSFDFIRKC